MNHAHPQHDAMQLRVTARRTLHQGHRFAYDELDVTPPTGPAFQQHGIRHRGAAVICPVLGTPGGPRVLLIRNDRPITGERLWELPAGMRDLAEDGTPEDPALTAARETIEETGYESARVEHLASFFTTPGITDELMHAYVATGLTPVGQALEAGEMITVHPTSPADAFAMIASGELRDAKSVLCLMLAERSGRLVAP